MYNDVTVRKVSKHERNISFVQENTPLVIEASIRSDAAFLEKFLSSHSNELLSDIATYGAVLLRGFKIDTVADFERQLRSISGFRCIKHIALAEPGRTLVDGTEFVFHTNTLIKTGGTRTFGGFHVENYHSPDVPRYVSFFCLKASTFGGETGLIDMTKVYSDLPAGLKRELESRAFITTSVPISAVMERFQMSEANLRRFCENVGLPIGERHGELSIRFFKPSVIEHPTTHERALAIDISNELARKGNFGRSRVFKADYTGLVWSLYRRSWRRIERQTKPTITSTEQPYSMDNAFVGEIFSEADCNLIEESMRRHFSVFSWKRGDILLIDNLKMAHGGMPGFGSRNLKLIMANRVHIPCTDTSGLYCASENSVETLGAEILKLLNKSQA